MSEIKNLEEQIKKRIYDFNGEDKFSNALELANHLINHFGQKATRIKKLYKVFRFTSVISISIVTILAFLNLAYDWFALKWIIPSISIIATVLTTLLSITNAQKDWVYNRTASQKFQRERFLYVQEADKYVNLNPDERVKLFSEELMKIWDNVHQEWENIRLEK